MAEVGYASLGIIPSFDGFQRRLETGTAPGLLAAGRVGGAKFGESAGRSAGARFGSVFSKAAKVSLAGAAGAGYLAFQLGKDSIAQASDLNESLNAVNVTYGKQARAVKALGRQSAQSLGLSNSEFNAMAVRFSSFADTIAGGDGKKTVKTLDDLTTRATDFASVMNLEVNEANDLFASGLAGESEPLRRFGIDLSAASVEAYAYANGIAKSGEDLTAAQKVQATYGSLMEQTNKTQGDFKNTSDQLANSQRILSARWDDAQAKLGRDLLPILTDATNFVIDKGLPAFDDFSDWFTEKGIPAIGDFVDDAKPLANKVLPAIGTALDTTKDAAKKIAPLLEGVFDGFNSLPEWAQSVIIMGAGAAAVQSKLKGGGLGGLASGAASSIVPIRTFETNPAALGGGVGAGGGVPAAGGKGVSTLGGLAFLLAGAQPDTIPLDQEGRSHFGDDWKPLTDQIIETGAQARQVFVDMRKSGNYTTKELHEQFAKFRVLFGDDFDSMGWKARRTLDEMKRHFDSLPQELKTQIVVGGVDEAKEAVQVALAPFMVGRNYNKESQAADATLPAPSRGRSTGGVTINQHIGTVNDSKTLDKQNAAKAQQAAMGGW